MTQILKLAHENQQLKRQINQYQQVLGVSPYVDDSLFKGGYRVVKTITDRDNIDCCHSKQGMIVCVIGEDLSFKEYRLISDCKNKQWEEIQTQVTENDVILTEDYSELSENLTTQKELNLVLKQLILNLQTQIDNVELIDEKVQITEATHFAQIGQTQKDFNKNVSDYKTNSDLKNQEQDDRLSDIEGENVAQNDLINGLQTALDSKLNKGSYAGTAQDLKNSIDYKLNKPTTTSNTASYPFVVGEDGNGNSARLPAGDLGKNFFNADLSNTTARNHTMNAGITVNTLGNPHTLSGLPNKNADITNFRKVRVQNTSGLDSVVDSKNLLTDGVTSMTDAEKDAWRLAQRKSTETYNTSTPQILVVNPFLIKNTDNFPLAVAVTGSNLFINLANSIVTVKRVKDSNGNTVSDAEINITQYVMNSESNNLIMLIYYNFYNATTGYYELKIQNHYGLQNLTSPQFLIVEDYDLTPMLPFTVINSNNQLVNNTTINNNAFEADLVPNVYGGILFDKLYDSINGDINCIFDLDLAIKIPKSDYVFGEIFLGLINNDFTNNISPTTFPKIGFKISNINPWSARIVDINTNTILHTFYWSNDLIYYSKLKIFIKDGTYTITNVITGQVSQGFYNDFNELRFLISKTYSTSMAGGVLSVSVSNFKKL